MKKVVNIILILLVLAVAGVGIHRYMENKKYEPLRKDCENIANTDYTSVFFSTFPIDNYKEDDFAYFREIYPLKSTYVIPDYETLQDYFTLVTQNGREITSIYLGIRPDVVNAEQLLEIVNNWYGVPVDVYISYPSLTYWEKLSDEEFNTTLAAYKDFINTMMPYYENDPWIAGNVTLYFYSGEQWLVGNPLNYESDFGINEGISHSLSMYSDRGHNFYLTTKNYEKALEDFETLVSDCRAAKKADPKKKAYPDLSKWDVVFFGDSIMAFQETTSIPGAFSGLTKAHVYNCAQGGTTAAECDGSLPGLVNAIDAFLAKDVNAYAEDSGLASGITEFEKNAKKNRQKCFVIEFGMNDYFSGYPVRNENDPYDNYSYSGALRTGIEKLQNAYPDATIILVAPNFTNYYSNGLEPQSAQGGMLPDYVAAMDSISQEYELPFYNSYTKLGIDSFNFAEYLLDGCHPNEATRYKIAEGLANLFRQEEK